MIVQELYGTETGLGSTLDVANMNICLLAIAISLSRLVLKIEVSQLPRITL